MGAENEKMIPTASAIGAASGALKGLFDTKSGVKLSATPKVEHKENNLKDYLPFLLILLLSGL